MTRNVETCSAHSVVTCEFDVSPIRSIKPLTDATSLLLASSNSLNFSDELPAFQHEHLFCCHGNRLLSCPGECAISVCLGEALFSTAAHLFRLIDWHFDSARSTAQVL